MSQDTVDFKVVDPTPQVPSSLYEGLEFSDLEVGDRVVFREIGADAVLHLYNIHPTVLVTQEQEVSPSDISDWENPDVVPALVMDVMEVDGMRFAYYTTPTGSGWSSTYKLLKIAYD